MTMPQQKRSSSLLFRDRQAEIERERQFIQQTEVFLQLLHKLLPAISFGFVTFGYFLEPSYSRSVHIRDWRHCFSATGSAEREWEPDRRISPSIPQITHPRYLLQNQFCRSSLRF